MSEQWSSKEGMSKNSEYVLTDSYRKLELDLRKNEINDLRKAAEMALKALDALYINDYSGYEISKHERHIVDDAQEALSKALSEPVKDRHEPVAWIVHEDGVRGLHWTHPRNGMLKVEPLYTAPLKREWVELTDDEIEQVGKDRVEGKHILPFDFARAIEAKLKEKNS